ncbi:TPA: hypothetical protein QFF34_002526, partial [Enterococcus faecium]
PSNRYVDSVATSITSEEVTFSLDGTFMSEAGYYKHCYVEYRKGNQILTTQDIIFFSLGVSDISQGQADEYVSQLEELIRKYNETFDAFMAETKGRVDSLNQQITDLTGQAKTLQDKLDALKEEISKLGNLQVMYSNSIDFGNYDYSGNPNIAPVINDGNVFSLNNVVKLTPHGTFATSEKIADGDMAVGIGMVPWSRFDFSKLTVGKQYTLTIPIRINADYTGDISKLFIRIRCANTDSSVLVNTKMLPSDTPKEELVDISTTFTVPSTVQNSNNWYCHVGSSGDSDARGTVDIGYDVKLEEGSTATPYQPNLLDDPYWLGKAPLGENIADHTKTFPIKTRAYSVYSGTNTEPYIAGQQYTITMKATKPATQVFNVFLNAGTIGFGTMTPVEGLTDVWQKSVTVSQDLIDAGVKDRLTIYQVPNSSVGDVQIEWLKIEKGDTRTPNISEYKYRGIGMRDSNNPKDYVWDLAPEYVEAEVTKKVAQVNSQLKEHVNDTNNPHEVTKNQVGLGNVDNFSTATQTEAEKGEASNKFMTPQRTTQMITKRIATDAEVVAGTDLNKLVTPKSLDIYYRDRTQVAVASYGTEDIALTAKEELSEASWRYRRIGDIVEFYGRFKLKEATDIVNVHELPTGFRLSTDFDDTSWNVPLNIQKAANPTSYVAGAFVERQGTNLLRVGGNSSGNHYVSGWWYTDDPFPTG